MTRGMGVGEQNLEKHIQKQMGCMAGFLHIFDRHQIFPGKRIYARKSLPSSTPPEMHSSPEPVFHSPPESAPETETETETEQSQAVKRPTSPLPLPVFEFKEGTRSPWKFSREAPRLSLDSRAVSDAKGTFHPREAEKQRKSTSVVAKLMGLEDADPELRRSASESRVSRDLPQQYRFFDANNNFQLKQQNDSNRLSSNGRSSDPKGKTEPFRQKKSFYDSTDFYPEPKQNISVYGEIERRLKMRGIDEPTKDLDTLKQILEALQLKGLLHSTKSAPQPNQRNFVFDRTVSGNNSPIVVMKPARTSGSFNRTRRTGNDSPPAWSSPRTPEPDRITGTPPMQSRGRNANAISPSRSPNRLRKVETQRKPNVGSDSRRTTSPVNTRRNKPDQQVTNRSPRMRKAITHQKEEKPLGVAEDALSTFSESSFSTSSQIDIERYMKVDLEYREGMNLLQRCDKLLNSIAEITGGGATTEQQPSPVSVLDSSFYKDGSSSCSPSPVMKRCIEYKDPAADSEDDVCSEFKSEDGDFAYVSEILRASSYLPEDSDVFLLLEKQQYLKGNDTSEASMLQRRLIFDTIHEILNRNRRLPPWKVENMPLLRRIWSEFRRIREREESEELFEVICSVLKKDMAEDANMNEWGECPVEMGDVVLDIERFVFKDLIVETIQDLASFKGQRNRVSMLRRRLEF